MRSLERLALRVVRALDSASHRLLGWRYNPLHQSGAIAVALLALLIITGLYLLIIYRVSAPWESVARLQGDPWLGRWIRGVHRYASDALVLAVGAHVLRLFAQARSWGPRTLAWTSGVILLLLLFTSGWTGFVMVWDTFGVQLANAGARLLDVLPIFSEPIARTFAGDRPVPSAFFFLNLFLHVALPLGAGAGIWLHVSRIARPTLLPPRPLLWGIVAALVALAVALPAPLPPRADPFVVPGQVPLNLFYAFWVPPAGRLPVWWAWGGAIATFALALLVPRLTRRPREGSWAPSVVDPRLCTGCNQCPQDCPWEAITMRERDDGRPTLVAHVDPALCVSCGICAGSCAPMGVGPVHRTGRDQLVDIRALARDVLDVTGRRQCSSPSAARTPPPPQLDLLRREGAIIHPVTCSGNLHSSVVELALRGGAAGVILFSCPPRDCRGREGPTWLDARLFHEREAELQARVDRRRRVGDDGGGRPRSHRCRSSGGSGRSNVR
ncbi:MAG: cytochrome b N-terminal domain-containing protein [Gemmatimonadetes bacterium]|nr:cytochrome b N-terminal domain-containing protein [Gemmatimonadota bacterium]